MVEQARLPLKPRLQSRLSSYTTNPSQICSASKPTRSLSPSSKSKLSHTNAHGRQIQEWQHQIVCGPGHIHSNFESQRPGTKFKASEGIWEQIWRPSLEILDEVVTSLHGNTSLEWPDLLRFQVLEETRGGEDWYLLYSKEHYQRKPLMRNCYLAHGWNKQFKMPIWFPKEVRNPGTLRSILEK